ncbi:Pectin lyase-like protein [Mycena sanguinolenta]|uniref:pectin lyase n=1 Tax=Mycena sanguinolenta TaxID=230812 RepID=A0A8H7CUZ3_9AGAR|nr:Pectin lyase-like protein [Mycena sanguinolenta]
MKAFVLVALAIAQLAAAQSSIVTGTAPGFAAGVTGGGSAPTTFISTTAELITALESSGPMNIVIGGTFDFRGTEGTTTLPSCFPYTCVPSAGGQGLLNTLDGCGSLPLTNVVLDTAGIEGINVQSDKTLVGLGTNTQLIGKGLRFVDVSNIIIQNIEITNLNPEYVWGGDALVFSGTSKIWIDHVTTSLLGRQHYSFGESSDDLITISNSFINGVTTNSATCDGHTYWGLELVGSGDRITFYSPFVLIHPRIVDHLFTENYVLNTSGRSPALSGNTLFHAVNNVWENNSGHLIEGTADGMGVYEGNAFINTPTVVVDGFVGQLYDATTANAAQCVAEFKRDCVANSFSNAGAFPEDQTGFFADFNGLTIVSAASAASIVSTVPASAGNTLPT